MSDDEDGQEELQRDMAAGLAAQAPGMPKHVVRSYHVPLTLRELLERIAEHEGVKAYEIDSLPDLGGAIQDAEFTLEMGSDQFTLHCGPPAARGQSATGMFRLLYLRGHLTRTEEGTRLALGFAYRRPRWALQRWVGFLSLCTLSLVWVVIGPGDPAKKAMLFALLLAVLIPVVIHDIREASRLGEQERTLLNFLEHLLGPIQLDAGHPDAPYRRRLIDPSEEPQVEDEPEPEPEG